MLKILALTLLLLGCQFGQTQPQTWKTIEKKGMTVKWRLAEKRIFFEMQAPTTGWVTVGFNTGSGMQGAYLLMGRIVQGRAELVEHYTRAPGDYLPISSLGAEPQVADLSGEEKTGQSRICFSLPQLAHSRYQRELTAGHSYTLILAYSREDDFQHHSMMRTSLPIQL